MLLGLLRPGVGGKLGQNKRALSAINKNVTGAPPLVPCVVITEKLAAHIVSKQQQQPAVDVTKRPPVPVAPNRNESEDCIIIDAEDYKATGYSTVPMFVQHTEAMMEEIDTITRKLSEDLAGFLF